MMDEQSETPLTAYRRLDVKHQLSSNTFLSSPCGKFKIKCRIDQLSFMAYSVAILYYLQDYGERYKIGQELTFYHETAKWTRSIVVRSRKGNLIEADILQPTTILTCVADNGEKTTHICELVGNYCDLYRVVVPESVMLDGSLSLHLANGEDFSVKLRWKDGNEICFQSTQKSTSLISTKFLGSYS